jgi:hypothetical protein
LTLLPPAGFCAEIKFAAKLLEKKAQQRTMSEVHNLGPARKSGESPIKGNRVPEGTTPPIKSLPRVAHPSFFEGWACQAIKLFPQDLFSRCDI